MGIISNSPTLKQDSEKMSSPQNTAVGGGSRPTASRIKTETSAPIEPRLLDGRGNVPGALGMGKRVEDVR